MNPANSRFLLDWINSNASSDGQKVGQITDDGAKNLLLDILHLIDKETAKDLPSDSDVFDVEQVLSLIISYLGGFHQFDITTVVDAENLEKRDELEIGKMITLLLYGATQCENVAVFINQITGMDVENQFTFKYLIESVLTELNSGSLTEESFNDILCRKVNVSENQKLDQSGSGFSSPLTIQSPVEAFFTNSPLKSLVASPKLRGKQNQLMLNKLQQKVTKLQNSLDLQMRVQSELEAELTEKNTELDARDATIIGLRSEIAKLLSCAEELEIMRHFKTEFEKTESENARLKQKVVELQTFKQQCGDLEQKVANFMQEKEQFENERVETERLQSSIERYKSKIHHMEFKTTELEATLSRKEQIITKLQQDLEEAVKAASKTAEMKRERLHAVEVDDVLLEGDWSSSTEDFSQSHVPIASVNIDSRVIELELEKQRLKSELSSSVNQEEYLALKEKLEVAEETHSSYKENYITAKCRIQELEERLDVEGKDRKQLVEQLKNVQEQCFQEVEELKATVLRERSLKTELAQELDVREKRVQESTVEIQALTSLKAGLEGSLQTSNARAHDDRAAYEREISLKKEEVDELCTKLQGFEEELKEKAKLIHALEKERDQVRDEYEKILADLKSGLDEKINSMAEDKATAVAQFRLRTNHLEEDLERMKEEFGKKQKAILEEAEKNVAKVQEACDADRVAWKKKFDQLSEEVMNTRTEMFENSKRHSEELIEVRRKAREGEERFDEEARVMRSEKMDLENQLLKANSNIAELVQEAKRAEDMKKKLDDEQRKSEELKIKCDSYSAQAKELQEKVEQLEKDAVKEKENFKNEIRKVESANKSEVNAVREVLENVRKDYTELEMKQKNEVEKILEDEKKREDEFTAQMEEMRAANEEKGKRIQELESLLEKSSGEKTRRVEELELSLKEVSEESKKRVEELESLLKSTMDEKEEMVGEMKNSEIRWANKQEELDRKIKELDGASEEMKEAEVAFAELRNHMDRLEVENERLEKEAQEEALINRRLGTEVHSLEAQLAHAVEQIREQKINLENKKKVESQRRQTIGGVRSQMYPRQAFLEEDSSTDSDDGQPLGLEELSSSIGTSRRAILGQGELFNHSTRSLSSLHSASTSSFRSGVQTRASRRQSAIYMRGNTPPEKRTTNSAAYFILGDGVGPEMEPDADNEFDWTRLAELQRRNASCLPHLQTSYPVETQMGPDFTGQEDALKTGRMSLDTSIIKPYNTRKRKSEEAIPKAAIIDGSSLPKSKSAPSITPAKQSRKKRFNQAVRNTFESLRSRSNESFSTEVQDPENAPRRESIAFNIEISPPKKTKVGIARRRTISRYTGTTRLLEKDKSKDSLKKSKTQHLGTGASEERRPLRPRQEKSNVK